MTSLAVLHPALQAFRSPLAVVGPMGLGEHAAWFLLISLMTFLVYSGLREEDLAVVVRSALARWVRFLVGSAVLFGCFAALSAWL
ncbi:MAG: hypothetical protein DHS20C15_10150 [Planctomycetota bacterium]|nr:MAG: hypothetical protein DHS20C15_10150 [Planctomycetota bacterium]